METTSRPLAILLQAGQLSWAGVDLFFVLSGFLIGGILLDNRDSANYYKTFYWRRFYRIIPLYFTVLAIFFVRHLPFRLLPGQLGIPSSLSIPWGAYLTLTQNFWMAHIGSNGSAAMAVTWSLAIEEQFYLTVPILIRKIRPEHVARVMVAIILAAPILRFIVSRTLQYGTFACFVLMPCRSDTLCMGVLSAYLVRRERFWSFLVANGAIVRRATAILFAGVAYMSVRAWDQFSLPMVTLGYSWIGLFCTGCLLLALTNSETNRARLLNQRTLMKLGTLAYCTYLIHYPLIQAGRRIVATLIGSPGITSWLLGGWLGVAMSLIIATASWKYFEKPLLRLGHKHEY